LARCIGRADRVTISNPSLDLSQAEKVAVASHGARQGRWTAAGIDRNVPRRWRRLTTDAAQTSLLATDATP
jgi:hypothetical protein